MTPRSEETKRKISESLRGRKLSASHRAALSSSHTGLTQSQETRDKRGQSLKGVKTGLKADNSPASGSYITKGGYRSLTGQDGHPLAHRGEVLEHRSVLFAKVGDGPHPCHWCGVELEWGSVRGIQSDHLDEDKLNNDPNNLVVSCVGCNMKRSRGLLVGAKNV